MLKKGFFITLEGCEGSGKSTQLKKLKEFLVSQGCDFIFTREPGGTPIAEKIRTIILDGNNVEMQDETEALLYARARVQHIKEKIIPAKNSGKIVICDRYIDSSFAYQSYARGLSMDFVRGVNSYAVENCMPDVTIFLDRSPAESFRATPGDDRMEQETREFHNKVYEGYKAEMATSNGRIVGIKPDFDRNVTKQLIINALRERGAIK